MRPLLWVSKSHQKLAVALAALGYPISAPTVAKLLVDALGFRRQVNRKTQEGANHPDRDAQFEHIKEPTNNYRSVFFLISGTIAKSFRPPMSNLPV